MSAPPTTHITADPEEAEAIRRRVREADLTGLGADRRLARTDDAPALAELLSDPAVSDPLYDLPRPFTVENVRAWIARAEADQRKGEALLVLSFDEAGLSGFSKFSIWPDRASGELAGGRRANLQSRGEGGPGAAHSFGWMFEHLGLRLIGLTAALDNVRSARLIERAGFVAMGERDSRRPDGSIRRSRYWELSREAWRAARSAS